VDLIYDVESSGVAGLVFCGTPFSVPLSPVLDESDLAVGRGGAVQHINLANEVEVARDEIHVVLRSELPFGTARYVLRSSML
jgi:hypothetical protein